MSMRTPLSWPKKAIFGLILAIVVALVAFAAVESALRLGGYGHTPGFWRVESEQGGRRWIRENWWVTAPFFAPALMRRPQPFRLVEKKAPDTYRIFILGSSAAMGDPEPSFSIARQLEVLLREAYPQIHFEVVNAAITAINSHVVRGIAADCAKLQPDLFVVYEGNNEVIGPFGPGTIFTPVFRTPAAVRSAVFLRGLRTGQALTALARNSRGTSSAAGEEWGGMQMFLQHEIARDDPRLQATRELFADNLRAIARAGVDAGATVVLGTVLTNQRDFAPFVSRHRNGLSAEQLQAWERAMAAGSAAVTTQDLVKAEQQFRAAEDADDAYAETHFQRARTLLKLGRQEEAKSEFQQALDLDTLRFRTDSRLNQTIREVAAQAGERVVLADFVKEAEKDSLGGVLGDEMLYEHVHLSFRGTYLVAKNLLAAVHGDLVRRGKAPAHPAPTPVPVEEVRRQLAFTVYEQAMIGRELIARFKRQPFTGQSTNPERLAAAEQRDVRATQLLTRPESTELVLSIYDQAIAHAPDDWMLHRNYGMALAAMRRGAPAKAELVKALSVIPDDPDTIYGLVLAHRELNETAEAERRIVQLRALAPRYPGLANLK